MQYAVWIALAVVALAIVPPILKNRRESRGEGTSSGDGAMGDGAGSGDCGSDGGSGDGGGCD
jgi:uncharacterized membrane protein YgcG